MPRKKKDTVVPVKKEKKVSKPAKTAKTINKVKIKKEDDKKKVDTIVTQPGFEKQQIITEFQVNKGDTGSPEVQVALLTKRVEKLVSHLKNNPSDNHSRRGLLGIVSKRRRLLNYLGDKDQNRYQGVLSKLGLNK